MAINDLIVIYYHYPLSTICYLLSATAIATCHMRRFMSGLGNLPPFINDYWAHLNIDLFDHFLAA
jgi:hypothetical protein